jgi:membrane dipeptidase
VHEMRRLEEAYPQKNLPQKGMGRGTVAYPELRKGNVAVSIATVIARVQKPGNPLPGYRASESAFAAAQGQLAYYRMREEQGVLRMIGDWPSLEAHLQQWEADPETTPLGIILTRLSTPRRFTGGRRMASAASASRTTASATTPTVLPPRVD